MHVPCTQFLHAIDTHGIIRFPEDASDSHYSHGNPEIDSKKDFECDSVQYCQFYNLSNQNRMNDGF